MSVMALHSLGKAGGADAETGKRRPVKPGISDLRSVPTLRRRNSSITTLSMRLRAEDMHADLVEQEDVVECREEASVGATGARVS